MRQLSTLLVVSLALAGCGGGEQQGSHAVSTVKTSFYENPKGFAVVFFGNRLNQDSELVGRESAVLCVVYAGDSEYAAGYDATSIQNDRYTSTFSMCKGDSTFRISWNRRDGLIKVANRDFNLADGTVIALTQRKTVQLNVNSEYTDVRIAIRAIADQDQSFADLAAWAAAEPICETCD